jgi:hypothetical protein
MSNRRLTRSGVEIDRPCPAALPALTNDERRRFCQHCSQDVHNLSAMTEPEARALLDTDREMCIAYDVDDDGGAIFRPHRATGLGRFLSMAAAAALTVVGQTGCGGLIDTEAAKAGKGPLQKLTDQARGLFGQEAKPERPPQVRGGLRRRSKRSKVRAARNTK